MRNSESRKRADEQPPKPSWPDLALTDDVRLAAAEVWHGCETVDALALLDHLADRGLRVVRR